MNIKKEAVLHLLFFAAFFLFISIFRDWFNLNLLPFWIGGIIGTFLPDVDKLLNVYVFNPKSAESTKVSELIKERKAEETIAALSNMPDQNQNRLFHSARFQFIFLLFTFWVVSSSNSLFGWGLTLAFTLHLLIDQAVDYVAGDDLSLWFRDVPIEVDVEQRRLFFWVNLIILLFLGLIY